MKYFYITDFKDWVTEMTYSEEKHRAIIEAKTKGGTAAMKDNNGEPLVFSGGTIDKILTENQYDGFLDTKNPRKYILRGTWYDKKGNVIRNEPWKQRQIEERKQRLLASRPRLSPEQEEAAKKRIADMMKKAGWDKGKIGNYGK